VQALPQSLVIAEHESLVLLDRPAQRSSELVALEAGRGTGVEVVGSVQNIVPREFEQRSVQLVRPGLRDNQNLRAGPFAVLRAVGVRE